MGSEAGRNDLLLSRPVTPARRPRRMTLRLTDGYETSVYVHGRPGGGGRLPVLYAHGIQSHPGWFVSSAAALADCGHAVFQVTRRGSGDNRVGRGHARSAGQLLDDVASACRFVLEQTGQSRLHLLGVSWGGKLLAAYAAAPRRDEAASLTLLAPGIVSRVDVPLPVKAAIVLSLLAAPRRRFAIPLSEVELFTDNEHMREYLRRDPFRLQLATAGMLYASRRLDVSLRRAKPGSLAMPTTLILSRRDRIIDNAATRAVVERLASQPPVVSEFDGAHTLEFEADPRPLFGALAKAVARGEPAQ